MFFGLFSVVGEFKTKLKVEKCYLRDWSENNMEFQKTLIHIQKNLSVVAYIIKLYSMCTQIANISFKPLTIQSKNKFKCRNFWEEPKYLHVICDNCVILYLFMLDSGGFWAIESNVTAVYKRRIWYLKCFGWVCNYIFLYIFSA